MIRIQFHDGREFEITDAQAQYLRDAKNSEKSTNLFTLTDHRTGRIICEDEFKVIKGFKHADPREEEKLREQERTNREMAMRSEAKRLREKWTDEWLAKNDDGSILEAYVGEAVRIVSGAMKKGYCGPKFANAMARVLIRKEYECPDFLNSSKFSVGSNFETLESRKLA